MVNEQINDLSNNMAAQFLQMLLSSGNELARVIANKNNKSYVEEKNRGLAALLRYQAEGGTVMTLDLTKKDAQIMEHLCQSMNLPYNVMNTKDEHGQERKVLMYREIDKNAMDNIKLMYMGELNIGMNELPAREFAEMNKAKGIITINGLSRTEVELFRRNAKDENITYTILHSDETGKYDIGIREPDKELAKGIMREVYYDLDNQEYEKELNWIFEENEKFEQMVHSGKEYVIVDKENPNHYIKVHNGKLILSEMAQEHEIDYQGGETCLMVEKSLSEAYTKDERVLGALLKELANPVIVPYEEFTLNRITDVEQYLNAFNNFKENESIEYITYHSRPFFETADKEEKIITLQNISHDVQDSISKLLDEKEIPYMFKDNSLAFHGSDYMAVNAILFDTIYKGKEPLEVINAQMFYEGRIEKGLNYINLQAPEREFYIVSAEDDTKLREAIHITDKGFEKLVGEEVTLFVPTEDPEYPLTLWKYVNDIKTSVAVTPETFESMKTENMTCLHEYLPDKRYIKQPNRAVAELREADLRRKKLLMENISGTLDERQQRACERAKELKYETYRNTNVIKDKEATRTYTKEKRYEQER